MITTTTYTYNSVQIPEAYVTTGKNRVKQYGKTVYMNDKQEFEIELFNPKTTAVLAKIKLNGTYISTRGIYIKPGQRIFLDRFIDNNNKFLFSTYEVENSGQAKGAIANNGDVEIEFYDEYIKPIQPVTLNFFDYSIPAYNGGSFGMPKYSSTAPNQTMYTSSTDILSRSVSSSSDVLRSKAPNTKTLSLNKATLDSIETGRVEKGSASNQSFTETWGDFNTYTSNRVYWKIVPQSQEPVQIVPQVNFCTSCGTKIKKESFKYCPNCGNKLK